MSHALISEVRIAAAHDGVAELVITLTHGNGGTSQVTLDAVAANALLAACSAGTADELVGHGWHQVRDALAVAWNRFQR